MSFTKSMNFWTYPRLFKWLKMWYMYQETYFGGGVSLHNNGRGYCSCSTPILAGFC